MNAGHVCVEHSCVILRSPVAASDRCDIQIKPSRGSAAIEFRDFRAVLDPPISK